MTGRNRREYTTQAARRAEAHTAACRTFVTKLGLMSDCSQGTAKITVRIASRILRCLRRDLARIEMGDEPQKGLTALGPR